MKEVNISEWLAIEQKETLDEWNWQSINRKSRTSQEMDAYITGFSNGFLKALQVLHRQGKIKLADPPILKKKITREVSK